MPSNEEAVRRQELNQRRAHDQNLAHDRSRQQATSPATISFPWGMFFVAVFFDIVGEIPIINIVSETLACLVFGYWQKTYAPKTDIFMTLLFSKIAKVITLGFIPDNIGIVIYAYIKKKAESKLPGANLIAKTTT